MVMMALLWGWSCCYVRAGNHSLGGMVGRGNLRLPLCLILLQTWFSLHISFLALPPSPALGTWGRESFLS